MRCDVAIIGAGLNGLTAALALASPQLLRPLSVILIDAKTPDVTSSDTRGSALTLATQAMLHRLGLWDTLKPHAQDMRKVMVTDGARPVAERPALLKFTTAQDQKPAAAIVENGVLLTTLRAAVTQAGIATRFGTAVTDIAFGPGLAKVRLGDDQTITASLIIGADGRNSRMRQVAGIAVDSKDYHQSALTFTVAHDLPHEGEAQEHFLSDGVLASLPLPGNRSSIVWAKAKDKAEALMALDVASFTQAFSEKIGQRLGRITLVSARNIYPLSLVIARQTIAARLALVGDAAHVIHPLAGLGLNLGFKDAAALADVLHDAARLGQDLGSASVLESYARHRRFDTLVTTTAIDVMNALFTTANPLVQVTRGMGLQLVDRLPFAKDLVMREAAGLTGSPPRLMRGLRP